MPGLEPGQRVQRFAAAAQPGAAGEVRVDEVAPDRYRHPVRGLGAPRHELDREARLGGDEDGAAEQQQHRDRSVVQALQVAGRGDLQVVGARHREVDLGHRGEAGDHRRDRGELDRLDRLGPAGRVAEQVVQPLRLGRGVAAAVRLDADLAAQRDRVHPDAGPLGDGQLEGQGRRHGVPVRGRAGTAEDEVGHVSVFQPPSTEPRGPVRPGQHDRAPPQAGQERLQRLADLRPAVEPLPVQPELADQRVAHVDRDQEDLVLVDEDGLGVRRQLRQQRVRDGEPVPGLEVELAFGDPARARVARHHPAQRRVVEEERHRDRDLELVPVRAVQRPLRVVADPLGYRPVPAARPPRRG